jgi:hypothetical protein
MRGEIAVRGKTLTLLYWRLGATPLYITLAGPYIPGASD